MTAVLLGPVATLVLGDLGADVIKIEPPQGDTTRGIGQARHAGMASLFLHTNRNKRSLVLDLKQPAGKEALRRLLRTADVLFHNKRPQALVRLGFGYDAVAAENPRIIYCGAFGYGQRGRYANRAAYDDLIQGAIALPELISRVSGKHAYVPAALIDRMIALTAVYSITAALYHRERTGEGQSIEIPMFENMAQMVLGEHMGGATFDPPIGGMGYARLLSPFRKPYRTSDGYICALTYTDTHWRNFFEFVGRPELAQDPRYSTLAARTDHIDEIYQIAEAEYAKRSTDEWVETLERLDIPVMRMNTLESLLVDPHLADVGFFGWAEHPTEGKVRTMAGGSTWSKTQPDVRSLAPRLGEHSRDLLAELGYSDGEIDAMLREGVSAEPQSERIVQESEC